ncbi:hypothetical protein B9Q03_14225 [Candidatus Marsarchaeota G2 archaeon OSP_D]|uniref:Uncharacterized protein n=2 Tax=Candidatus Marsarchaeota group 2 TaxID=2203771 RepID=A0A2R6CC21_9ARCH|nr:MAG: hypothetical protein B9Q03_14225 [Candidatus Marsarchaeota G2 archaeon OSP_D]PSO08419.1 MAG: hypothetical protein B9Q04_05655 [Candidatus Marsarchaeota G2 archaeon BE_D]
MATALHHESTAITEYSRGFGLKPSFSSTFLVHSSTHDFETDSESTLKKPEVFLRLSPKALSSIANKTLISEEPLLVPLKSIQIPRESKDIHGRWAPRWIAKLNSVVPTT